MECWHAKKSRGSKHYALHELWEQRETMALIVSPQLREIEVEKKIEEVEEWVVLWEKLAFLRIESFYSNSFCYRQIVGV